MNRRRARALILLLAACSRKDPPNVSVPAPPPSAEVRFLDRSRSREDRLVALQELRSQDAVRRHEAFPRLRDALRSESARLDGFSVEPVEEKSAVAALEWLAEEHDELVPIRIELHLDREIAAKRRLSENTRAAVALLLARYPGIESARETLWKSLRDENESALVRTSCLKALQAFHPKDLEELVLQIPAATRDTWLRDLQQRLR